MKPEVDEASRNWFMSSRTLVSFFLLYLSTGFLLTFTVRWPHVSPDPAQADFLSITLNPHLYFSALSWPFWLVNSLV